MRLTLIIIIFHLCSIKNAFAYLDPGTGSIIIQAIIGFVAAVGATVSLYWQKLKLLFRKVFKKKKNE